MNMMKNMVTCSQISFIYIDRGLDRTYELYDEIYGQWCIEEANEEPIRERSVWL